MVFELINNIRKKYDLYSRKQKHLNFVGQRLYDLHSEITTESMELHKLKGAKFQNKINRLVLLSSNIDRYKKYLKLITFMKK
tara:strand:- start:162 stop:407 length:246 start_codon:yes stop_codon:yes gene_type:complete